MSYLSRLLLPLCAIAALAAALMISPSRPASADQTVTISVGDLYFCAPSFQSGVCETDIHAGDTVVWNFGDASVSHTTTECGASCDTPSSQHVWSSGTTQPGGTFQFRFTQTGTYLYQCQVHPLQMRGKIVVQAAAATPTSPPAGTTSTPGIGATATPSSGGPLPVTGQGPQAGGDGWWWLSALALAGGALIAVGATFYRRARA